MASESSTAVPGSAEASPASAGPENPGTKSAGTKVRRPGNAGVQSAGARAAGESLLGLKRRARRINRALAEQYPYAHAELDFRSPFELVVATVLSAQTTDVTVNQITPLLFARYPDARSMAEADPAELEAIIKPTGFFRAKTRNLMALCNRLVDEYDGEVPGRLDDLVTLPGVGRKTANVVLGNAFGIPGITVDTHFGRLARRFGWTESDDPVRIESDVGGTVRAPATGPCSRTGWCSTAGACAIPASRPAAPARWRTGARATGWGRQTRRRRRSC